jgi:hypothetical protein
MTRHRSPAPLPRHRTELTPHLRDAFTALLLTWPVRQATGAVVIPGVDPSPTWILACEEQYGDGHYDDRKELLTVWLDLMDRRGRTEFVSVHAALQWSRTEVILAGLRGRSRDRARRWEEEREKVHRYLTEWLPRALQLCHDTGYATPAHWCSGTVPALLDHLNALLVALQPGALNPLTTPWLAPGSRRRRERSGPPGTPWMPTLRNRLARAGVPRALQTEPLIAVGLLPYTDR